MSFSSSLSLPPFSFDFSSLRFEPVESEPVMNLGQRSLHCQPDSRLAALAMLSLRTSILRTPNKTKEKIQTKLFPIQKRIVMFRSKNYFFLENDLYFGLIIPVFLVQRSK